MLELSHRSVVIAFSEVDSSARQPLPIDGHLFRLSHANVTEKIKDVIRLDTRIHSVRNRIVHLLRVCKRTLAVSNDVEVSEVEVGREPNVTHDLILVGDLPKFQCRKSARPRGHSIGRRK
jgi:hypothetical protein